MGIEIGPKGHLFYVDNARDEVVRVDPVLDEDGDGYDNIEKNLWLSNGVIQWVDKFPNNSEEWNDTDDDGIGNNADLDDDNDGWSDNDEINCSYEGISYMTENPLSIPKDTDGDGICEFLDYDDDNDGWSDEEENTCAYAAGWIGESSRTVDSSDYPLDTDGDRLCNPIDEDDDNDGRLDENDIFPLNLNEWSDNDNDGIGDNEDLDDDNDILTDKSEIENGTDPNNSDTDSDGYSDNNDIFPLDAKDWLDLDDDGVGDNTDIFPSISRYQYTSDLAIDILLISIMGIITLGAFSLFKRINREDW